MPDKQPDPAPGETPGATPPAAETPPAIEQTDITNLALNRLGYELENELPPEAPAAAPEPTPEGEAAPAADPDAPAAAGETPAEVPAAEAPPVATPPAAPVVVAKAKKKLPAPPVPAAPTAAEIIKGVTDALRAPAPAAAAPTPTAPVEPELNDIDKADLELARYAAEAMPEKYKGFDAKVLQFVKERDAKIQEILAEDGTFDPNGDAYQKFIRERRPVYQGADRTRLTERRIKDEATKEADARIAASEKKYERQLRRLEATPKILAEVNRSTEELLAIEDEAVKAFKEDPTKAADINPFEAPIIATAANDVRAMTEEYLKIANDLVEPDAANPVHVGVSNLVRKQGEILDQMPESQRLAKDGRVYVSRETFAKLPAAERGRFATFDDAQVVVLIREFGKQVVNARLKDVRARLEKAGYKRQAATVAPVGAVKTTPAAPAQRPANAPKATSTPATAAPQKPVVRSSSPHLKALGMTDPGD